MSDDALHLFLLILTEFFEREMTEKCHESDSQVSAGATHHTQPTKQ